MECWRTEEEDSGDPPRLWAQNGMYPGTAFTRSIGDARASLWLMSQFGTVFSKDFESFEFHCNPLNMR